MMDRATLSGKRDSGLDVARLPSGEPPTKSSPTYRSRRNAYRTANRQPKALVLFDIFLVRPRPLRTSCPLEFSCLCLLTSRRLSPCPLAQGLKGGVGPRPMGAQRRHRCKLVWLGYSRGGGESPGPCGGVGLCPTGGQ